MCLSIFISIYRSILKANFISISISKPMFFISTDIESKIVPKSIQYRYLYRYIDQYPVSISLSKFLPSKYRYHIEMEKNGIETSLILIIKSLMPSFSGQEPPPLGRNPKTGGRELWGRADDATSADWWGAHTHSSRTLRLFLIGGAHIHFPFVFF